MENENTIKYKSKKFAVKIVNLYMYLCDYKKEYISIKSDCEETRKMISSTTKTINSTLYTQKSTLTNEGGATK